MPAFKKLRYLFTTRSSGNLKQAQGNTLVRASAIRAERQWFQSFGCEFAGAEMALNAIFSILCCASLSGDLIANPNKKNPGKEDDECGKDEPGKRNRDHGVFCGLGSEPH